MPGLAQRLLNPLNFSAMLTMAAVGFALRMVDPARAPLAWSLFATFACGFVLLSAVPERLRRVHDVVLVAMAVAALALIATDRNTGASPVLLVIWTAAICADWPMRRALPAGLVANVVFYFVLRDVAGSRAPLMIVAIYAGFQLFAALCMHYARTAERARDQLALVNADLLATRALLAESARDAERLRVARELHDVAGHKLTAMRLNLRALAADPVHADNAQVRIAEQLSGELLADIRGVVQALRDDRGLDLATALRALAAPMPRPSLALAIADDVAVADPVVAELLLRLVQESLVNASRHADADTLTVAITRAGGDLHVAIEDDGRVRGPLREGNGIAGMRERLTALHGRLVLGRTAAGGLRLDASLPA